MLVRGRVVMKGQLIVTAPSGDVRTVALGDRRLLLGRSSSSDLSFPDELGLSRQHAALEQEGEGWVLTDLGSRNGTYVNGVRVEGKQALQNGDRITASRLEMVYHELDGERPHDPAGVVFESTEFDSSAPSTTSIKLRRILTSDPAVTQIGPRGLAKGWTSPTTALLRAGRELAVPRPLSELFEIILDLATEAAAVERGVLMTLEEGRLIVRAQRGSDFRISKGVRDRVLDEKVSLIVADIGQDREWRAHQSIVGQGIRSLMAVPLQTDDRVIGLLYLDSQGSARRFTSQDLELLTVMANVAAIRIERERLAEVERTQQRLESELRQAAEIQQQCLPAGPPTIAGIDIAGYSAPCRTVGGDYYGYFSQPDGKLCIVVGDVAGKGMPASLLMMNLQARVQVLAEDLSDPAAICDRLNRSLERICPANRFITLFIGILDPESGALSYCNAGHERALLARAEGEVEELGAGGPIVGILTEASYEAGHCTLRPGDALVIYSDGVTEAPDPQWQQFGQQRVAALFQQRSGATAQTMVEKLNQAVEEWLAGFPAPDDITVVTVIRLPGG